MFPLPDGAIVTDCDRWGHLTELLSLGCWLLLHQQGGAWWTEMGTPIAIRTAIRRIPGIENSDEMSYAHILQIDARL